MLIAWIQQTTLLDYPGKVATIIFTAWCNLRCRFCHNPEMVLPEKIKLNKDFIPQDVFFNFLEGKKGLLDGVVICGWEPTIQPDLEAFCIKVKEFWFLVKLDTNGRDPLLVERLIDTGMIDYVAMDIKEDMHNWNKLVDSKEVLTPYHHTIRLLLRGKVDYEFRTTLIKRYHTLERFPSLLKDITWAKKYILQSYRSWNTLDKNFDGETFNDDEMEEFRHIALQYVDSCEIRK